MIGQRLSHFKITAKLGEGGMGEVYVAFDETLRRKVAIKAIAGERHLSSGARSRFLREARILSQLDHPNICRIYDYIEDGENEFLVLELIEGQTLDSAIEKGMSSQRKLRIARDIAAALAVAHVERIIHRDLKPGNVMLTAAGEVKVLDFGLARAVSDSPPMSPQESPEPVPRPRADIPAEGWEGVTATLPARSEEFDSPLPRSVHTEEGTVVGTPLFMSPEQARGEQATTASDMYSFGLLLQALFTGRSPYQKTGSGEELLKLAAHGRSLSVSDLPGDQADLIGRLKALAPAARPTAVEALEKLDWILDKPKRRLRAIVAAAVLFIAVVGALKYTFDLRRERTAAVAAQQMAEQRRSQAENLIGFMLGDLREKLEPLGRLEILDDVGDKAIEYFAAVDDDELTDAELSSRSRALYQIGEVRLLQDEAGLAAALAAFRESLALAQGLVDREPLDVDRQFELSQSHFWVGFVFWKQRQLDRALDHFESYLDIAQWLVGQEPDNPDFQLELAYAYSNIGSVLEAQGDLQGALTQYLATLGINETLVNLDPENLDWQLQLAEQHNLVGVALRKVGDLEGARKQFEAELGIKSDLVVRRPENSRWRERLANSHHHLGLVEESLGDLESAHGHFLEDLEITAQVARQDPSNTRWRRNLSMSRIRVGRSLADQGREQEALDEIRTGLAGMESLTVQDPSNVTWQLDLAKALTSLGDVLARQGDVNAATGAANRSLDLLESRFEENPEDRESILATSEVLNLVGRLEASRRRDAPARTAWERSVRLLEPLARDSTDARILDPLARGLIHLDRLPEAIRVTEQLWEMGYRYPAFLKFCRESGVLQKAA